MFTTVLLFKWYVVVMNDAANRHGVDRLAPEAAVLLSHALQLRLRTLLEKLSVVTDHRREIYRVIFFTLTFELVC